MSTTNDREASTSPAISEHLYRELTQYLHDHTGEVLAVEVLPAGFLLPSGSTSPILQDGRNLGITKKALVLAFLVARKTFFDIMKLEELNDKAAEEAMTATQVILLFDPEYITAANFRKKRFLRLADSQCISKSPKLTGLIKNELMYLETLFTSPLHRHTKSPTLWHHRRWLVKQYFNEICQVYNRTKMVPAGEKGAYKWLWMKELDVVMRSGDRHPNNYYAWTYARWLLDFLTKNYPMGADGSDENLAQDSAQEILNWCLGHPTDISGWSFLLHLFQRLPTDPLLQTSLFKKVWDFTCKLSWDGEALWWFIRTVLATRDLLPASLRQQYFQHTVERLQQPVRKQALEPGNSPAFDGPDPAAKAVRFCARFATFEDVSIDV